MRALRSVCDVAGMAAAMSIMTESTVGAADGSPTQQDRPAGGPPEWVVEAWKMGEAPVVPDSGPPAWVVEAWSNGERPQRPSGVPPWVARRHTMAKELGLPGPPDEAIEAWENGEGTDLPGPPSFVREMLGF